MEATGVYHERLATELHDAGFRFLWPTLTAVGSCTWHGNNDKNDKVMLICWPVTHSLRNHTAGSRRHPKSDISVHSCDDGCFAGDALREENWLEKYLSTDTPADIISSCRRMAQLLREEVSNIERQIKAHIKACPALRRDYTLLTSIKSVGPQLGMHMLVVLRSHNFASAEQAAAFLGVVPIEKRSGTSVRSRPRMSKIGPPQLRAKLYMSALCGKIYNKRMRNIYDEMCLRGKPKMVAIGALMRKLVHWCYGVLKTGTVFNDESLKQVLST
ncbi:transposase, IS110 family [Klebsiella pneumoniae]|uniref:Transposase, IS110 family n=1 Tax=Klebsiella pneumoniae TaxID=573 RepID=A0A2X3ETH3_KLEPN|nr:transposase, IS110 family [Klebsiella pneumoniae]